MRRALRIGVAVALLVGTAGIGTTGRATATDGLGLRFGPMQTDNLARVISTHPFKQTGLASFYARMLQGRRTTSGEPYDMHEFTAAHRTLPLQTRLLVTNLTNGRTVRVRINDRGPFAHTAKRIVDLSYAAAKEIDLVSEGVASVMIEVIPADQADEADRAAAEPNAPDEP